MNNVNHMCVICSSISMSSIDHIYPREIDNKMHDSAYRHSMRLLALRVYFDLFSYFKHPINLINRCWWDVLVFCDRKEVERIPKKQNCEQENEEDRVDE